VEVDVAEADPTYNPANDHQAHHQDHQESRDHLDEHVQSGLGHAQIVLVP
jgi:hypothetical protein